MLCPRRHCQMPVLMDRWIFRIFKLYKEAHRLDIRIIKKKQRGEHGPVPERGVRVRLLHLLQGDVPREGALQVVEIELLFRFYFTFRGIALLKG